MLHQYLDSVHLSWSTLPIVKNICYFDFSVYQSSYFIILLNKLRLILSKFCRHSDRPHEILLLHSIPCAVHRYMLYTSFITYYWRTIYLLSCLSIHICLLITFAFLSFETQRLLASPSAPTFYYLIICIMKLYYQFESEKLYSHHFFKILIAFISLYSREAEHGQIIRKKWNSMKISRNYMNILSFASWLWISYFRTTQHWFSATKKGQEVQKCHKIRHFEKYALEPFGRANVIFVIYWYHFVAL